MHVLPAAAPATAPHGFLALIDTLRQADAQASAGGLPQAMGAALQRHVAAGASQLLTPAQCRGSAERYTRHLLYAHPLGHFAMVALVWHPGQRTPVHGHYTWCAYAVLQGELREERYDWDEQAGTACLATQAARPAGAVISAHAGLQDIHRLCNASDHLAISLHVYGVDGERVSTHVNRLAPIADEVPA